MKKIQDIPFLQLPSIPALVKDFLSGNLPGAGGFIFTKENFERQMLEKQKSFSVSQREILHEVLASQAKSSNFNEKQAANLDLIKEKNTFTVTTGHQLNLFTGPVFFIYKILQTIKTAEWLKAKFPGSHFVPIFWMATEDHDFEEINHFRTEENIYRVTAQSGGAVGRITVGENGFITEFEKEFRDTPFGAELLEWLRGSYAAGTTLAAATRHLVNRLFSQYGLLILDGDDARLKSQMKGIFREELLMHALEAQSKEKVAFLKEKYGKVQVNPREINLFYLDGKRERIDADGENFRLAESGKIISRSEMLQELEAYPEKFSPNALLRPVYQETVLPNVAYIGGNAEVMYWLELPDFFRRHNLPFPVLVPRNSMLFLAEKTLRKIQKAGLAVADLFGNLEELKNKLALQDDEIQPFLDQKKIAVQQIFNEIKSLAQRTEKTFGNLVSAEETRQLKSFQRMEKRLLRAAKIKHAEKLRFLENLYAEVHPGNTWQERRMNFSVFYSILGRAWLRECYAGINPEKSDLIIVEV